MELFSYSVFLLDRRVKRVYSLETERHSKTFFSLLSPRRFLLAGRKMHRYRVLSPECVSRKDGDESRSRSTFRPWLQFQKSSRGRAKTRFPRLPCFQTSSVHVINDDQSGREMLLERGYALWRDVVAYGSHVFRKSIFINDLVIHTSINRFLKIHTQFEIMIYELFRILYFYVSWCIFKF